MSTEPDAGSAGAVEPGFGEPLLEVSNLKKYFGNSAGFLGPLAFDRDGAVPRPTVEREWVRAVDGVGFDIRKGETLGLVGESGCGKSTLARTLLKLVEPTDGEVRFKGVDLADAGGEQLRRMRKDMQIIFQDPQSSLDPRMKVGPIIEEPMKAHDLPESDPSVSARADVRNDTEYAVDVTVEDDVDMAVDATDGVAVADVEVVETEEGVTATAESDLLGATVEEADDRVRVTVSMTASKGAVRRARVRELLGKVGLDPQHYNRYPHQFSGGQRQRINLARALSVNPDFIVCDEPTSALDASIQAQVLNTMNELQDEFGLTYLFISHDLSVIRYIADRVAVMYLGEIVELADKEELFENPKHPYTDALLSAIPAPDPRATETRAPLEGDVPSPIDPPSGCRFRTRCPELIAPPAYDFSEAEWDAVRAFTRAVDRRAPAIDAAEADEERDAGTLRRELRRTYFEDVDVGGEAGEVVDEAIAAVVDGDHETADALLQEAFAERSICAREDPNYVLEPELGGSVHKADCHLHRGDAN